MPTKGTKCRSRETWDWDSLSALCQQVSSTGPIRKVTTFQVQLV